MATPANATRRNVNSAPVRRVRRLVCGIFFEGKAVLRIVHFPIGRFSPLLRPKGRQRFREKNENEKKNVGNEDGERCYTSTYTERVKQTHNSTTKEDRWNNNRNSNRVKQILRPQDRIRGDVESLNPRKTSRRYV